MSRVRTAGASALLLAAAASGCLGSGTARVDAACREMGAAVVWEMLRDNPSILFLDVRSPREVAEGPGRLARSRPVPVETLPAALPSLAAFHETTVVIIGKGRADGMTACSLLASRGFKYVIFVADGADGWFASGLPATTLEAPAPTPTPLRTPGPEPGPDPRLLP